jgi:hypothetical protein
VSIARREYFGKLLEAGLRKIFYDVLGQASDKESLISVLYSVQSTSNPDEQDVSIGGMAPVKKFTGTVTYDRMYQGYSKTYEFPEYADGFGVERKLYDDQRYNIINKRPTGLALGFTERKEQDAALVFNYANATTGVDAEGNTIATVGPDLVALCSATHPTTAPDGPAARSNYDTLALNHTNLRLVHNRMLNTRNDRGTRAWVNPDTILVGLSGAEMAWELNESPKKIDTAENNPNIHYGKYRLIIWRYLTDDGRWFLIDSRLMKMFLLWWNRVSVEFAQTEEFDELLAKYRGYGRWSCGFSDWMWVYGCFPT